ncbi:MAG TPA: beta-glucosidase, partial [Deltaproteobacteria bacterium]|nr:beta-glucosidase [Deltaproteobacteria bacterium]
EALAAAHHVMLSHGRAVPVIRANSPGSQVGITLNLCPAYAASPSEADADASRHFDGFFNRWFLDPCYGRPYPADMVKDYQALGRVPAEGLPFLEAGDIEEMGVETDFLGINFYSRAILRSDKVDEADNAPRTIPDPTDDQKTDMGWEIAPDSLRRLLVRLDRDYPVKQIIITENGAAWATGPDDDGRVRDVRRRDYFHSHLSSCLDAIEEGAPLTGYFGWSFMDNFEWALGYGKRFGLIYVDYETQQRTLKDSALWYARVASDGVLHPSESV